MKINVPKTFNPSSFKLKLDLAFEGADGHVTEGESMKVVAGARGTWRFRITNQERRLGTGSLIHVYARDIQFAHKPQNSNSSGRDYMTLETDCNADFVLIPSYRPFLQVFSVLVQSGDFQEGESLTVRLGDRRHGAVGSEVFWAVTDGLVEMAVDPEGMGQVSGVLDNPFHLEVIADQTPRLFRLLGPSICSTKTAFDMHLGVFDRNGNVIEAFTGTVSLFNTTSVYGLPEQYTFTADDKGNKIFKDVKASSNGVHRIGVRHKGISFTSNPIVIQEKVAQGVYWGDIHCHSWGDATIKQMSSRSKKLDPLSRHKQARDIGRLDFAAPGPTSPGFDEKDEIWEVHREAAKEIDEPGKYVPYLSFEAHPSSPQIAMDGGDRNLIFQSLDEPIIPRYDISMKELEQQYGKREDVIIQTHIGGNAPMWDVYLPQRERMLEISSGFGNAEWLLQKALHRGFKPAVCGCSDLHLGLLGGPRSVETYRGRFGKFLNVRDSAYGTGPLTAVMAERLDRDSIWQSMTDRRTYATSGSRMVIDFTCNGHPIGSEIARTDQYTFRLSCHGTEQIDRIDLISGKYIVHTLFPEALDVQEEIELTNREICGEWIYMRVYQSDNQYGWTTPIWIRPEFPVHQDDQMELNEVEPCDKAGKYLPDVIQYLTVEEDISKFHRITPIRIEQQTITKCAVFYCNYGDGHKMSIRWFFDHEIPKIRYDWGWTDEGTYDDEAKGYFG